MKAVDFYTLTMVIYACPIREQKAMIIIFRAQ